MLRPILTLAAVGVAVFTWKVLGAIVFPLAAGVIAFVLKIAFVVALALLVVWLFRKRKEGGEERTE